MIQKIHKYRAKATVVDGIRFDSKAEASYYQELKLLEKSGSIRILEIQPKVYLTAAKILYRPDFFILDLEKDQLVYIDVKGFTTPVFQIKKRLWKHYGIGLLRIVSKNKIEDVYTEIVKTGRVA